MSLTWWTDTMSLVFACCALWMLTSAKGNALIATRAWALRGISLSASTLATLHLALNYPVLRRSLYALLYVASFLWSLALLSP